MKAIASLRIAIPFIWAGLILAISFIEAPLKFTAPNITLQLGLGIGQIVFHALNKLELVLLITLAISLIFGKQHSTFTLLFSTIAIILLIQTLVLFPPMDERASEILSGKDIPSTWHHITYVILEIIKLVVLLLTGIVSIYGIQKTS
ncbi:MAG: hypothetical protein K1X56_02890 [Flavobacteriales bacterium]|nr:hypothetical protein [Flavobacteriales bacterium]